MSDAESELISIGEQELFDGGRITIPKDAREDHGIGYNDVLHVEVTTPHGETFEVHELPVRDKNSVTIPSYRRQIHDLADGDGVDVVVRQTGKSLGE